jgi:hypothetical protein
MPTTFAYSPTRINTERILEAVRNGNTFISNGPLVFADIKGKTYGNTVSKDETSVNIELFCRDGLKTLNIYKNGIQMKTFDLSGNSYLNVIELNGMAKGDWIVFEVYGTGVYYAITNPIFFT